MLSFFEAHVETHVTVGVGMQKRLSRGLDHLLRPQFFYTAGKGPVPGR
jgi:hypothetical protein